MLHEPHVAEVARVIDAALAEAPTAHNGLSGSSRDADGQRTGKSGAPPVAARVLSQA